ncbi:hypothetical protein [Halomonas sp. H5]|uniref:hypothetical protein n=1 Tax=Halomonas sp. H5 TaxID=3423910 RepID=UPI003D365A63
MKAFIVGVAIGFIVTLLCFKVAQSKRDCDKSNDLLEAAKIYLKNGWFLGALKNLHVANHIKSNPKIDYAIGYASFKLEDFEEAARGFCNSTCFYLEQKKKPDWENRFYLREFSCDSYFMWVLSEAMQDNDVSWSNCWKYCSFALNDIDNGLLPRTAEKKSAPLVDCNDYEAAFRILRMFSGVFSSEASLEETLFDIKWLNSELKSAPYPIEELQNFIGVCNECGFDEAEAIEIWSQEIRTKIISNKSGVDV